MSDYYGNQGKEEYLKELHSKSNYSKQPRRFQKVLDDVFEGVVEDRLTRESESSELMMSPVMFQHYSPMDKLETEPENYPYNARLSSATFNKERYSFFCWFDRSDEVKADFFNFFEFDARSVVLLLVDIPGYGPASGLVATGIQYIFDDYFHTLRNNRISAPDTPVNFPDLLFRLNEVVCRNGFSGRFAAIQLLSINTDSGNVISNHAGSNIFWLWDRNEKALKPVKSDDALPVGQFDSKSFELFFGSNQGTLIHKDSQFDLAVNDILFLMTDGCEQSYRKYRDRDGLKVRLSNFPDEVLADDINSNVEFWKEDCQLADKELWISCKENGDWSPMIRNLREDEDLSATWEMFGFDRIESIITASLTASFWELKRRMDVLIEEPLVFDFTELAPSPENAVLAVAAVERVFRLVPHPDAGEDDIIKIEKKLDAFMKGCFQDFGKYYRHPLPDTDVSDPRYTYYSHVMEDPREDDFILIGYQCHHLEESQEELPKASESDASIHESSSSHESDELLEELEGVSD